MGLGIGAFAHSTAQILKDAGVTVSTYLTRNYGHYPASLAGPTYNSTQYSSPCPLLRQNAVDLVVPMSIDWAQSPWKDELLALTLPILVPPADAITLKPEPD